jgi:lysophospholipase L1-like esterase
LIKYDYTVTVTGNTAKLDKDIYLFRGNKNVHYYFAIKNASFNFKGTTDLIEKTNAINAAVTVVKPNAVEVANAIAPVENGKIHLKVTEDLIDEEVEVGDFDLVFDLFDDTDGAVTIPKVIGQFHVLERPCTTPISELVATNTTNEVDQALTDYAIVTYAEPVASTNADGTFAKKTWVAKEKITTAELNRMEEGISDVSSQCKDIAKKIDEIASSGGSGGSSGTTTSDYDTEISLPFTASKDTDVKVVFSKGDEISNPSYTNEVSGNTPNDFDVQKYGSPTDYTLENVTEDGINCLKFQYTGGVHYYRLYSKQDTSKKYGSDIYFVYMKIKLVGDADATYLPQAMTHISYNTTSIQGFNGVSQLEDQLKNITDWQELCIAGKVAQNDNYMNLKPYIGFSQITGTVYIARMCLVNLTTQGLESKTKDELLEMARSGRFDNGGSTSTTEFSCTVTNGSVTEDITPFTDTGVTKYYTVSNGNTFSVSKRTEYGMPSIQVFIKSSTATEIEDSDIKINTRFKGKKVIFEGDSITDYDYLEGYNNKSWANYLTTILGMNLVSNGAVGGSLLTHSNEADGYSVQQRIANITYDSNTKLFLIHAGTNDWGQAKTLGEIDSTDISTICGALNNIIDKVQTNCPKATIVIISPIHRQSDHGGFLNNSANYSLYDVAIAYEKICKRWGVKFINGLEIGLNALNSNNLATNYLDGLHPTPIGHKIMAVEFARKIATF